ncbi:MAG: response regulator [Candidatus Sericytochromatia bacterium]|nr:response regulator [Candidatus Tanganyikabacteria bacterium]
MKKFIVLVVDDDAGLQQVLGMRLRLAGHDVLSALDGSTGLDLAYNSQPDLIVLDIMLPRRDGLDVLRTLRQTLLTPVVMLTARAEIGDRLEALSAGADDYMLKPFSPRELEARISAILADPVSDRLLADAIEFRGDWVFDLRNCWIRKGDQILRLTRMEYKLLRVLALHPGRPFTRSELLHQVWGYRVAQYADTRVVDAHIQRLRAKLGGAEDQAPVRAHPGVGYIFAPLDVAGQQVASK